MTDDTLLPPAPEDVPATVGDLVAAIHPADAEIAAAGFAKGDAALAAGPAPSAPVALPFAVDQSHALDNLPAESVSTKTPGTMITNVPDKQTQQLPIGQDDILHHLPNGSTITVLGGSTKQIALTLPANAFRKELTVIGTHLHAAVAGAWHWIKDETATIEAAL